MAESKLLSHLKFDPKTNQTWLAKYLANPRLVILLVFLVCIMGLSSFFQLPRNLNPEIKIPIVLVQTVLPGAGPADVESLVTVPLEDVIASVDKVKTVQSTSADSVSIINIEFESGVDPDKARSDVQSAVDTASLPDDAVDPKVQKLDFENTPVWTFTLTGPDQASLYRFARSLQEQLKDLPSIDQVSLAGLDQQEIQIVINPEAVSTYQINQFQLSQIITSSLKSFPAGNIKTADHNFSLTIDPVVTQVDDLRQLQINLNGELVPLSAIASISQISKPDQTSSYYQAKGGAVNPSISFSVFRSSSFNIDRASRDAEHLVDEQIKLQQDRFQVHTTLNAAEEIDHQFAELQRDFFITIGLVFIVLLIFLGARQAIVAALVTPLTFFITFTVMQLTDISLSFIALFSLLLSLGLLVDDTIVVISAMTAYHRAGRFTGIQTGLLVWRDFLVAIFTTTITTVWAFLPLLLASGIIGEFIKPIPIVVSTTLMASFFVAMFITLPFMIILLNPQIPRRVSVLLKILVVLAVVAGFSLIIPKDNSLVLVQVLAFLILIFVSFQLRNWFRQLITKNVSAKSKDSSRFQERLSNGFINFEVVSHGYEQLINRIITSTSNRRITMAMVIIFSLFSYILLPLGFVQNEFFPKSNEDYLYLNLELPAGSTLDKTKEQSLMVMEQLQSVPEIQYTALDLGQSFDVMNGGSGQSGSNTASFNLHLDENRKTTSGDIAQKLRSQFKEYQTGKLSVIEVSGGPPAGSDIQIKLLGNDLSLLDQYAGQIQDFLKQQPGTNNINKSIKPGTSKLTFTPDLAKLSQNGVSLDSLGITLRSYVSGFTVDEIKLAEENNLNQDITLRFSSSSQSVSDLGSIMVSGQNGSVPLASLGTLTLEPNPTQITREDGKRTLSVSAGVSQGYNIAEINTKLEQFATSLDLPSGYNWKTGGVNEENQNSVNSILQAMLLSFLLIIITMVIQFQSFRRAMIVMLVIPLSISGVFIIFALSGTPLSFPALIGVLALFGIVVKNSILIVDKIVQNQEHGLGFAESISNASASRLEAIALTSICTIAGLIPITLSDPLWRGLGGAIIAGLAFSGTIMLFFIPVVYYLLFRENPKDSSPKNR